MRKTAKKTKKYTRITQKDLNKIENLFLRRYSYDEINEKTGRSHHTIWLAKKSYFRLKKYKALLKEEENKLRLPKALKTTSSSNHVEDLNEERSIKMFSAVAVGILLSLVVFAVVLLFTKGKL